MRNIAYFNISAVIRQFNSEMDAFYGAIIKIRKFMLIFQNVDIYQTTQQAGFFLSSLEHSNFHHFYFILILS